LRQTHAMNGGIFWVLLAGIALGSGCRKPAEPLPPTAIFDPGEPTQANPKLQTLKLHVGTEELVAELALTAQQERTGMMFRTNMEENAAMLFPLGVPRVASFWMKNCPLPLSIAYIDGEGIIREIHDLEPHNTNSVISASSEILFALETPRGWFQRHNIREGMAVATERGTLRQTFYSRQ
jgi:uncharacterized protein